jgi:hypothetical protein
MATTLTLQNSMNFAQSYAGYRQLNVGASNEPAITAANIILQTIVGAPFVWNWNRSSVTFNTIVGTQDYATAAATFGFIEKADFKLQDVTITNTALSNNVATYTATNVYSPGQFVSITGTTNGGGVFNVTNQIVVSASATQFTIAIVNANVSSAPDSGTSVSKTTEISNIINVSGGGTEFGPPAYIAPQIDDNAGNITFRLNPASDQIYTVRVVFQKRIPALFSSLSGLWAPIPDHYSYIYQNGFVTLMLAYVNDPRWMQFSQKFVGSLLGAAEGLSEDQKNVFSRAWYNSITEQQFTNLRTQQGVAGLGAQ